MQAVDQETLKAIKEWKKIYINAILDDLNPSGNVLEIGFSSGDAAKKIQEHKPKSHTIIESNPKIAEQAKAFAKQHPNVTVIQETWTNALKNLKSFDAIFYNDYPLETEADIVAFLNLDDLQTSSAKAKEALALLEEKISKLKIKFSDQDIEDFLKKNNKNVNALPKFFTTLRNNGNITEAQYAKIVKKIQVKEELEQPIEKMSQAITQTDPMFKCLENCLQDHMQKGSRFSAFVVNQMSRFEDAQFFGQIITNPAYDYTEKLIEIHVATPKDVKLRKGLVFVVKKL